MPRPNVLAAAGLDRDHLRRADHDWIAERLADPHTLVAPVAGTDVAVLDEHRPRAALLPATALDGFMEVDPPPVFLGLDPSGNAVFALDVSRLSDADRARVLGPVA